jgi:hypothetical protein
VPDVATGQETRLKGTALGEGEIISRLQARGVRVAVAVLDACRNNPFNRAGGRGVGGKRGFARSDPVRGVFSVYSAPVTAATALGREDSTFEF